MGFWWRNKTERDCVNACFCFLFRWAIWSQWSTCHRQRRVCGGAVSADSTSVSSRPNPCGLSETRYQPTCHCPALPRHQILCCCSKLALLPHRPVASPHRRHPLKVTTFLEVAAVEEAAATTCPPSPSCANTANSSPFSGDNRIIHRTVHTPPPLLLLSYYKRRVWWNFLSISVKHTIRKDVVVSWLGFNSTAPSLRAVRGDE